MQNHILENQNTKQENQNYVLEIWNLLLNNRNAIWKNQNIVLEKQTYTQLIHSLIYGWVKWVEIINSNKPEHYSEKRNTILKKHNNNMEKENTLKLWISPL